MKQDTEQPAEDQCDALKPESIDEVRLVHRYIRIVRPSRMMWTSRMMYTSRMTWTSCMVLTSRATTWYATQIPGGAFSSREEFSASLEMINWSTPSYPRRIASWQVGIGFRIMQSWLTKRFNRSSRSAPRRFSTNGSVDLSGSRRYRDSRLGGAVH